MDSQMPDKPAKWPMKALRNAVRTYRRKKLVLLSFGKLCFSKQSYIGKRADFYIPKFAKICDNVSIGGYCLVQTNLRIGSHSLISSHVSFIGNDHNLNLNPDSAFLSGRKPPDTIILEGNNFIGYGSILLGSITIGYGAVVAAGSLVNRDVPPGSVVGGVPAKFIKRRDEV